MLTVRHISKQFLKHKQPIHVLKDKSLSLEKGKILAIQGPSGCGKTTLLLITGGLLHPDSGQVLIEDQDLFKMSHNDRARFRAEKIGFIFQQYHLIPYLTVLENIMAPSLAIRVTADRARQLAEHFGLGHRLDHKPGELSSGEKQRTALARALVLDPPYLLADEITGNLDHENAKRVIDYMKEYAEQGGAVLWVTHDRNAAQNADHHFSL